MKSQRLGLRVAGIVFSLVCLAQLLRVLMQLEVLIGGTPVPVWPSAIAAIGTGLLAGWMWKLSLEQEAGTASPG